MRYFRRITRYDYWNLKDLYKLSKLNSKKRKDKIRLNSKLRILSQSDYKKYRSCSQYHQGSKGRLQGSSISGCLAMFIC